MKNDIKQSYVNEVTKSLWITPKKRREARQELLDHLQDIQDECNIKNWTADNIEWHLGKKNEVKKQFDRGGLPMWAKLLRWGFRGFIVMLGLLAILNFYLLWFYSCDDISQRYIQDQNSFVKTLFSLGTNKVDRRWMDESNTQEKKVVESFSAALNAWIPYSSMNPEKQPNDEDINFIYNSWTSITEGDYLAFPRPVVTEEDCELFTKFAESTEMQREFALDMNYSWLSMAHSMQKIYPQLSSNECIQIAKDTFFPMPIENLQSFQSFFNRFHEFVPTEKKKNLLLANARWIKTYIDSFNPNPEPLIDSLVATAIMNMLVDSFENEITTCTEIQSLSEAMMVFIEVDLDKFLANWDGIEEIMSNEAPYSILDRISMVAGQLPPFQWQCTLMQKFCEVDSSSYRRYQVLKKGLTRIFYSISIPNLKNANTRLKIAQTKQRIVATALVLPDFKDPWIPEIIDPFTNEPLHVVITENSFKIKGSGPDKTYDDAIYAPSNGTTSRGDIVWEITR